MDPIKAKLKEKIIGAVLTSDEDSYHKEVMSFNTAITHKPAYVVVVTSADDIKEVVNICREHSLAVHIQGAGHGAHSAIESGILISTSKLQHVTIDPENQLATI